MSTHLLHGEALLVVTAGDAENVASKLVTEAATVEFLCHPHVVHSPQLALVIDLDALLAASGRVCNVQLHARKRDIQSTMEEVSLCQGLPVILRAVT